jgi:hypothetical protein
VEAIRTPDERLEGLPDLPFVARYGQVDPVLPPQAVSS